MITAKQRKLDKEQFFTSDEVAHDIVNHFRRKEPKLWRKIKTIVEPSVGGGAFLRALPQSTNKKIVAYDIDPQVRGRNVHKRDFLTLKRAFSPEKTLCLGNPPFGVKGKLARQFINKCATIANHILFVVPINFVINNMRALDPNIHMEWWFKLPGDMWTDEKGNKIKRQINTAAVFYRVKDHPRQIVKRKTIAELNKEAVGGWKIISGSQDIKPSDVAFFRYSVIVDEVKKLKKFDNTRSAFVIVRLKRKPSKKILEQLRQEAKKEMQRLENFATVSKMAALSAPTVAQVLNKVFGNAHSRSTT